MKTYLVLFLCGMTAATFAQEQKLSFETQKLTATAKVWGFLKYYHPEVANGKYNWDQELLEVLPQVESAESAQAFATLMVSWIKGLGTVKPCKACQHEGKKEYFGKNFDLSWIDQSPLFSSELSSVLNHIEKNRHQGRKYYVTLNNKADNPVFTNEREYNSGDWQDKHFRLLTLFRYWNKVAYFFPYKYQMDTDWDEVLLGVLPKFLNPQSKADYHKAMAELITSLDDGHAQVPNALSYAYAGDFWFPAVFKMIDGKAVITEFYNDSLAKVHDLKVGDAILQVDDRDVEAIYKERINLLSGSNEWFKSQEMCRSLFNGFNNTVDIVMERNGQTLHKEISRYRYKELNYSGTKNNEAYKILGGNVGYIDLSVPKMKDIHAIMDSLKHTRALILDLRKYPRWNLYSLGRYISSDRREFYKAIVPDLDYPGKFYWQKGNEIGSRGELKYKGQVVLLVNSLTFSRGEFEAMALQTGDRVTTIGNQTGGADGNFSSIIMPGGHRTGISGIGIFYPDGTEAQRQGVKIDIEVKPTIEGIRSGKDEILDRALKFLSESDLYIWN